MKKFLKGFALVAILFISLINLCSCYDFYKDFHDAGATIEQTNNYEVLSLDQAKGKIDNKETFILVLATSKSSTCVTRISTLQEQATYFGFEGKLYFVDMTDYKDTASGRKNLRESLKVKGYSNNLTGTDAVVVCYTKGEVTIDTSAKLTSDSLKFVVNENAVSINYDKLCAYIFNDFVLE